MEIIPNTDLSSNGFLENYGRKVGGLSVWDGGPIRPQPLTLDEAVLQIAGSLRALLWDDPVADQQVVELRALKVLDYRKRTKSGYFDLDHLDDMAREALRLT